MKIFKYQELEFYPRLFYNYEEGPYYIPTGRMKVFVIRKPLPGDPKLYIFQEINSSCMFCPFSYAFLFVGDKVSEYHFKDDIIPPYQAKERFKFA